MIFHSLPSKIKSKISSLKLFNTLSVHFYIKKNLGIQQKKSKKQLPKFINIFIVGDINTNIIISALSLSIKFKIFKPQASIYILPENNSKSDYRLNFPGRIFLNFFKSIKILSKASDIPNLSNFPERFDNNSISIKIKDSDNISVSSILFALQSLSDYKDFSIHYFDIYSKKFFLNRIQRVFTQKLGESLLSNTVPFQCLIINPFEKLTYSELYLFLIDEYITVLKVFLENPSFHFPYFIVQSKNNYYKTKSLNKETRLRCEEYLKDNEKLNCRFTDGRIFNTIHVKRDIDRNIFVSIIIPFKDNAKLTFQCVASIQNTTDFKNYEIILVNNGSSESETEIICKYLIGKYKNISLLDYPSIFNFSAINNFAAKKAKGNILLFLNNDIFAIRQDWLYELVQHAQRPKVGAVGPLLLYPDKSIQHAGIVMGLGGIAGHLGNSISFESFKKVPRFVLEQNVTAVTGACLMVQKSKFIEVGGMDEIFPVAFNDVDFCLKLNRIGYENIYNPYSVLIHYESKSRGSDLTEVNFFRYQSDMNCFIQKWGGESIWNDDCYSNHFTRFSPEIKIKRDNENRLRNLISQKNEDFFKSIIEF